MILPLLLIAAFLLRAYHLGYNSLWLDEIFTLRFSQLPFWEIFNRMTAGEYNPPLFYWMEGPVIGLLGTGEVALRILPMIFGVLAIVPIYYLGKQIGGERTAMAAGWLATISSFAIYFSQEARAYSFVMLVFSAGLLYYFWAVTDGTRESWGIAMFCFSLACWSHFYTFVFLTVILGYTVATRRMNRRAWFAWYALGVSVLPLIISAGYLFFYRVGTQSPYGFHGLDVLIQTFIEFSGSMVIMAGIFMALFVLSLSLDQRWEKELMGVLVVVPAIIAVPVAEYITIMPRYLIPALGLYLVVIADSVKVLDRVRIEKKAIATVLLALLFSLNLVTVAIYHTTYEKEDYRGIADAIRGEIERWEHKGGVHLNLVAVPSYRVEYELAYYYDNRTQDVMVYGANTIPELEAACEYGCLALLTQDSTGKYPEGNLSDWISKNGVLVEKRMHLNLFRITSQPVQRQAGSVLTPTV